MKRIKSADLYPGSFGSPEGYAIASRKTSSGYQLVKEPWPDVTVGEEIEIETQMHWLWRATVVELRDADSMVVRPIVLRMEKERPYDRFERPVYAKEPLPLPPYIEGQTYRLPYMDGDAWSVRPEKGKILTIGDQHYRVTHTPKKSSVGGYEYRLSPVDASARAKRPGRTVIRDVTDPNPTAYNYYQYNVGRIIEINGEYLHIEKVQRVPYGSGEGDEIFGYQTVGTGHFVPAAKAEQLKAKWDARAKVRSLELDLRVAKQDIDYGGNPDIVPRLEAELEAARKIAGEIK